jgi:hypothetical protein
VPIAHDLGASVHFEWHSDLRPLCQAGLARMAFNRDTPDAPRTGANAGAFLAFLPAGCTMIASLNPT